MRISSLVAALAATTLLHACASYAQQDTPPAGPAAGPRGPMGPRFGQDFTPGWMMMTPEERDEHRRRMQSARTPEECRQLLDEHRKLMESRAKDRGMGNMRAPRRDACADWRG